MVFEKIKNLIAKELNVNVDNITMETHLTDDLGADSLDAVDLVMAVEEEFDIEIDDTAAQNIKRVGDIVRYVESKK